jgi:hypothetical protein
MVDARHVGSSSCRQPDVLATRQEFGLFGASELHFGGAVPLLGKWDMSIPSSEISA